MRVLLVGLAVFHFIAGGSALASSPGSGKHFDRIVTVFLENADYKQAMKNPYLAALAKRGFFLKNYHGVFHPSYPNYLAMVGGNYFWTWFDRQKTINAPTVADLLEAKGYTWKNYAEDYPGNCFLKSKSGKYVRKHVPFLSFKAIQRNPARCANVVNADQFLIDWKTGQLPSYSIFTPNNDNNGHDTSVKFSSAWLEKFLEPLLSDTERMSRTLFFITFDESDSYFGSNHIYTVMLGDMVRKGLEAKTHYNHYDHLRMVEENFALGSLDVGDDFGDPIDEAF